MANPLLLLAAGGGALLLLGGKKKRNTKTNGSSSTNEGAGDGIQRTTFQGHTEPDEPDDPEGIDIEFVSEARLKGKTYTIAVRSFNGAWPVSVVGGEHDGEWWNPENTETELLSLGVRPIDKVIVRIPVGDLAGVTFDNSGFLIGPEISKAVYWTTSMARKITKLVDVQPHHSP